MSLVLQLSGRLGNQLFQWSYAHNLSKLTGENIGLFVDNTHSNMSPEIISLLDCEHVRFKGFKNQLGRELQVLDWLTSRNQSVSKFVSSTLGWDRSLDSHIARIQQPSGRKFSGFFQDYAQVKNVLDVILPELKSHGEYVMSSTHLKIELPERYQFAHIRRGDLVASSANYGLLGQQWYSSHRNKELPLVLSTDDLEHAEVLIQCLNPDLILNPADFSAFETLYVMGHSKELIMANSTLSWWGALLATQNGGKAYFPNPFYVGSPKVTDKLCAPEFTSSTSGL